MRVCVGGRRSLLRVQALVFTASTAAAWLFFCHELANTEQPGLAHCRANLKSDSRNKSSMQRTVDTDPANCAGLDSGVAAGARFHKDAADACDKYTPDLHAEELHCTGNLASTFDPVDAQPGASAGEQPASASDGSDFQKSKFDGSQYDAGLTGGARKVATCAELLRGQWRLMCRIPATVRLHAREEKPRVLFWYGRAEVRAGQLYHLLRRAFGQAACAARRASELLR